MSRPMTNNPSPVTLRVRTHRRRKSLLGELQAIIFKRGDVSSLEQLEAAVEALTAPQEENKNE